MGSWDKGHEARGPWSRNECAGKPGHSLLVRQLHRGGWTALSGVSVTRPDPEWAAAGGVRATREGCRVESRDSRAGAREGKPSIGGQD